VPQTVLPLDATFLRFLLTGGRAFVNPNDLLNDLSADAACQEFEGVHHTIARIIGHLDYWQNWVYAGAMGTLNIYPVQNDSTFPAVTPDDWEALRSKFLKRLEDIKALCNDAELMTRPFSQGQDSGGGHDQRSVGETMLYSVALHNAHHYGQIITLRQQMNLWPPKAGSMTW